MLKNAPIVILDEATAFTDPENEDKLQKSIEALTKGKTLLVIAHRLSTIADADQIVVLKNGCVEAKGTQEELLDNCALYQRMWQAHVGARHWAVGGKKGGEEVCLEQNLYIGFVFSFFSGWFAAMPVIWAAYVIGKLVEYTGKGKMLTTAWVSRSIGILLLFVFLRFLFDYLRARFQEAISYELIARDRLAVGDALKRVSLGYFQNMNTSTILNSITTGLHTLEGMGIRMIDNFVGGYLNFICILLWLFYIKWQIGLIAITGAAVSFVFLLVISRYSTRNAPVLAQANRDLTGATLEYARGLAVVKSFGRAGASMDAMTKACRGSRDINLKIEWGYIPYNALHLLALKTASVFIVITAFSFGVMGQLDFTSVILVVLLSFHIFGSLEPISDCAHVLAVIDDALDHLDALNRPKTIAHIDSNVDNFLQTGIKGCYGDDSGEYGYGSGWSVRKR